MVWEMISTILAWHDSLASQPFFVVGNPEDPQLSKTISKALGGRDDPDSYGFDLYWILRTGKIKDYLP